MVGGMECILSAKSTLVYAVPCSWLCGQQLPSSAYRSASLVLFGSGCQEGPQINVPEPFALPPEPGMDCTYPPSRLTLVRFSRVVRKFISFRKASPWELGTWLGEHPLWVLPRSFCE